MDTHGQLPPRTAHEEIEAEHHEKKPVLKKVKDKVKKIKNAITKKSHGHGDNGNDADHQQHGDLDDANDGFVEDDEIMHDAEVHGAPMYESSAIGTRTGDGAERVGDGVGSITTQAPKTEAQRSPAKEESADVPPDLSRSLDAITEDKSSSYTEMVSSAASKVYGMVSDAGSAVISKVKPDAKENGEGGAVGNQSQGILIKEYIAEKLTPGEDEKALSELITDGGQSKRNESSDVPRQESGGEGVGVVDRLKETFSALLGGGESSPKSTATEPRSKVAEDNKDFHH